MSVIINLSDPGRDGTTFVKKILWDLSLERWSLVPYSGEKMSERKLQERWLSLGKNRAILFQHTSILERKVKSRLWCACSTLPMWLERGLWTLCCCLLLECTWEAFSLHISSSLHLCIQTCAVSAWFLLFRLRLRQQLQQRPKVGLCSLSALYKHAHDSGHLQESVSAVGFCICFHGENLKEGCPWSSHRVRTTSFAYS